MAAKAGKSLRTSHIVIVKEDKAGVRVTPIAKHARWGIESSFYKMF